MICRSMSEMRRKQKHGRPVISTIVDFSVGGTVPTYRNVVWTERQNPKRVQQLGQVLKFRVLGV